MMWKASFSGTLFSVARLGLTQSSLTSALCSLQFQPPKTMTSGCVAMAKGARASFRGSWLQIHQVAVPRQGGEMKILR
jgi:hypothetical protein